MKWQSTSLTLQAIPAHPLPTPAVHMKEVVQVRISYRQGDVEVILPHTAKGAKLCR